MNFKSNKLLLVDSLYLGKGRERKCFIHPLDEKKVIKIVYREDQKLNQNEMEYEYIKFLHKKNINFLHLTNCYGSIETNLGIGYIFDRVVNYDGKTPKSFKYLVMNHILEEKKELELIEELKKYIFENNILFVDIALSNILCQEYEKNKYRLILTDGIGGKRKGLKSKLYYYSKLFTKYKVKKQWKKFLKRYEFEKTRKLK